MNRTPIRKLVRSAMVFGFLLQTHWVAAQPLQPREDDSVYIHSLELDGVSIHAVAGVDKAYVEIAARVYQQMTSRNDPFDFRKLHDQSNFRILLINEGQRFSDLPEYKGQGTEIDQAAGLGGSIGEFFIGVQVGSPHTLVHELGHGIYHSAIQFQETNGEDDEEAWYSKRVQDVHGIGIEEAFDQFGEEVIHEVLLARKGTFSARLGEAWNNAVENELWTDQYAGTEPNEYWAEGVAMWFRAWSDIDGDSREYLRHKDLPLYKLCASVFPDGDWSPKDALGEFAGVVPFSDEERRMDDQDQSYSDRNPNSLVSILDRNLDGKIGIYEGTESILAMLSEADSNDDGFVQRHELVDFLESWSEEQDQHEDDGSFENELLEFLDEVDHDNDGAFSLLDIPESDREEIRPDFIELDRNADGLVTKKELFALIDEGDEQSATFSVSGESGQRYATMNGVINASTPGRVLELYLKYPDIHRIEMLDVPGSMDDESNLRAARYIRQFGYTTHVPEGGMVASGGTDFFLAGATRSAHQSAQFGVHSWGGGSFVATSLPRDHPAHQLYLEYYNEIGIPGEFYWFTLNAAGADDIHWMTEDETDQYDFYTNSQTD